MFYRKGKDIVQTELVKTDENIENIMPDIKEALEELEYIETHLDEYKKNNKWKDLRKELNQTNNWALRNLVGSKKMFSSKSGGDFFYESFEIWWGVFIKMLRNLVGSNK